MKSNISPKYYYDEEIFIEEKTKIFKRNWFFVGFRSELTNSNDFLSRTITDVPVVVQNFRGEIDQVPPIFSAVQVEGKRAYHSAREGEEVILKSRKVMISELEILESNLSQKEAIISLRIVCSKGTYIRSLAHDLGQKLETGGHLSALQRTKIGDFKIENAQSIEQFLEEWKPKEK